MSQQINLFNPVFLKQKKYFSTVTMLQALGMILLGSVLLSIYARLQLDGLDREANATSARLNAAQVQLAKLNATSGAKTKNASLEEEIRKMEGEIDALQRVFDTLQRGEFGDTKGYSEYLRAFSRQVVDGLWLTGFQIHGAGNQIGIQGRTLRPDLVTTYINRLKHEPVMQGKSFATLDMQRPVEPAGKPNSSGSREPHGYLEFSLRSSEGMKTDGGG